MMIRDSNVLPQLAADCSDQESTLLFSCLYGLLLWIGLLDNLFYGRSHISRPGELSIRFVLDESHRRPIDISAVRR